MISTMDSNDVWNRCMQAKYFNKSDTFDKVNIISGFGSFWTNTSNMTDESKVEMQDYLFQH